MDGDGVTVGVVVTVDVALMLCEGVSVGVTDALNEVVGVVDAVIDNVGVTDAVTDRLDVNDFVNEIVGDDDGDSDTVGEHVGVTSCVYRVHSHKDAYPPPLFSCMIIL